MNYIQDLTKLLEVEIDEKFKLKCTRTGMTIAGVYKLTLEGLVGVISCEEYRNIGYLLQEILYGKYEIIKLPKPILTDKEKEYLSRVIEPWKDKITYIEKHHFKDFEGNEKEFISIGIKETEKYWRQMELPLYDAGKYYKGMTASDHYTLDKLEL